MRARDGLNAHIGCARFGIPKFGNTIRNTIGVQHPQAVMLLNPATGKATKTKKITKFDFSLIKNSAAESLI